MSYAIVGFGKIGQALARAFARKNIDVTVASSVAIAPGESTFTRMPVPFRSSTQVRARLRTAALLAL